MPGLCNQPNTLTPSAFSSIGNPARSKAVAAISRLATGRSSTLPLGKCSAIATPNPTHAHNNIATLFKRDDDTARSPRIRSLFQRTEIQLLGRKKLYLVKSADRSHRESCGLHLQRPPHLKDLQQVFRFDFQILVDQRRGQFVWKGVNNQDATMCQILHDLIPPQQNVSRSSSPIHLKGILIR